MAIAMTVPLAALAMLTGCVTPASRSALESSHITPAMLTDASPLRTADPVTVLPAADILAMTPEMKAFVDAHVDRGLNRYARVRSLLIAVMLQGEFQLIYDSDTRTAAETFEQRRGNCMSFTNMFVAMARYLDIEAYYQEVEIPPDWSLAGESFLLSQHVNVYLDLGHGEERLVDFNIQNFSTSYNHRIISDERARAHYYNNIGAELMFGGETTSAQEYFAAALKQDPTFAPAWINLGILHRREGYPAYAEAAYLQALAVDHFNLNAMSNLANLYEQEGLTQRASEYQALVETHRLKNPYFRYHLAGNAFVSGDYATAIENLKSAIRQRSDEPLFYSLLSMSYLMSGDIQAARREMTKAEAVALETSDKQKYHHKLEWLRSQVASG